MIDDKRVETSGLLESLGGEDKTCEEKTHASAVPVVHGLSLGKHEWSRIVIAEDDERDRAPCSDGLSVSAVRVGLSAEQPCD